ncbi:HAD family hydrolase [Candidatus Omnitrophota bacterium]
MNKRSIEAIFFDLGNVIVGVNAEKLEKTFAERGKVEDGKVVEYFLDSDNMNRYMEGKLSSSQFYSRTKRQFKLDIRYGDFYELWNGIFYPIPEMEALIKTLKKDHPEIKLILVSNTNETHYDYIKEEYKILDLLDGHVVSHEVGCQKPDRKIFNEALGLAGSIPPKTFYVDDRMDLIESARVMGIHAYQFVGADQFQKDLTKCNIHI